MTNFITYDRSLNSNTPELRRYLALQRFGVKSHDLIVSGGKKTVAVTGGFFRGASVLLTAVFTGK